MTRKATADDRGEFRIDGLLPGSYRVTVTAKGFDQASANVDVAVSLVRDITVTLKPESGSETVNVRSNASSITTESIDTASAVHQGVVTSRDLETLPLAARSFANIAYLVPGTEPVEPSDPTKARITAVSTGGSSGLNNELSVDGADNSDDWIGGFLQNFSPDGIQEFAVRTANEDADTGGTTAGSVVITTKHGTNEWHGDAAFYGRAASLNARFPIENPAPDPKQPFSRQNYVGTLGGPLVKNKFWVFASFEHVHENASIAYSPASTAQFDALGAVGCGWPDSGRPIHRCSPKRSHPLPRLHQFAAFRLGAVFEVAMVPAHVRRQLPHAQCAGAAGDAAFHRTDHAQQLFEHGRSAILMLSVRPGSALWCSMPAYCTSPRRATRTLGFALAFPFSSTSLTVSGFETFGDNQFATPSLLFPTLRNQDKYQIRYDLSRATGDHSLKFGVNFIHEPVLSGAFAANGGTVHRLSQ